MSIKRLLFYDNIRNDAVMQLAGRVLEAASGESDSLKCTAEAEDQYYELQRRLLAALPQGDTDGSYWENYICRLVAESENTFSIMAENGNLDPTTARLAGGDLVIIRDLFMADWKKAADLFGDSRDCVCSLKPHFEEDGRASVIMNVLNMDMSSPEGQKKAVDTLADYYRNNFCGTLGKYRAFIWDGKLQGVKKQDPVTFDELIGYDTQQRQLIDNTEAFVKGRRANNVLLYGDKGTGKSSSVKALLNRFGDRGLRMINVPKSKIFDIGEIMESVAGRGCRFIIFIDDLSFEATEVEYKHFKSVLEGGVEVQPDNVLLYVTSNRRNLVKETWRDRNETEGEININDGIHERTSLADRFGLKITFVSPDRELYSEIVKSIAEREGLKVDEALLLAEANKWDMRQTSRSGRSAKQFVTHLANLQHRED